MPNCPYCKNVSVKWGFAKGSQRFRCKSCAKSFKDTYRYAACLAGTTMQIVKLIKEGMGIRSIARFMGLAINTVIKRIVKAADAIVKPTIALGRCYEMDELKTYIKKKTNEYWVIYAIDKKTRKVIDFKTGKRTAKNVGRVVNTLLISGCEYINTDKLNLYKQLIPKHLHHSGSRGTNHIERMNLNIRTHLKRFSRKTLAYSKSVIMANACLGLYFWG